MRKAVFINRLKSSVYLLVVTFLFALCIHLYKNGLETKLKSKTNVDDVEQAGVQEQQMKIQLEPTSLFRQSLTGKCVKRGDIDFVVTYTLWGNVMMPVFTISCSVPKPNGQKHLLISDDFFKKHSQEKPIVKFASARPEYKYTVLLLRMKANSEESNDEEANNSIRWLVVNVDGEYLVEGHYKWDEKDLGQELVEYRAPEASPESVFYIFVLFKQEEGVDLNGVDSASAVYRLQKLIQVKELTQLAAVAFTTGSKFDNSARGE